MHTSHSALHDIWTTLVAGWADHLDPSGANLVIDGIRNRADRLGSYEGTTRMMWGLGGWLSQPGRTTQVLFRGRSYDLRQLTADALLSGTDPDALGYWGDPVSTGLAQPTVESGQVAYALWQSQSLIWDHLSSAERQQIADWLVACGQPPEQRWRNNWALFWALNHTVRKALDLPFDQSLIDDVMLRYLDEVYCGDGWYDDGPRRDTNHFDDYNLWVFASHVLAWADVDGDNNAERRSALLDRIQQLMEHVPWFFAADGAYPEYGRSGAYKFARLGAPVWAYRQGAWPHSVGLLRTIVERHIGWYVHRGAIRADGTLRQALTSSGSDAIREPYISTGAPYWAMQAFGGLWSLPDDDPFWSTEPEPLPIERGDVHRVFTEPGWIVTGTRESGEVHRFTTHTSANPAKYSKLVYSTAAPYNAGLGHGEPAPDAMIALTDGIDFSHRASNQTATIHGDGWIRYRHQHTLGDTTAEFDSVIIPIGDLHLRIHRLVSANTTGPIQVIEGAAALGFEHGDHPVLSADPETRLSYGASSEHAVAIRGWDDRAAHLPRSFGDSGSGNIVHGNNVIPYLAGTMTPNALALSTVFLGASDQIAERSIPERLDERPVVSVNGDGGIQVSWHGKNVLVPV